MRFIATCWSMLVWTVPRTGLSGWLSVTNRSQRPLRGETRGDIVDDYGEVGALDRNISQQFTTLNMFSMKTVSRCTSSISRFKHSLRKESATWFACRNCAAELQTARSARSLCIPPLATSP